MIGFHSSDTSRGTYSFPLAPQRFANLQVTPRGARLMNWKRIGDLVRLRYKLMWAKTRSRNGKIALFVIGYLLFAMVAALVGLGGVGAGIVAIQTSKAESMAQVVLSGLLINALMAAILLGFGVSAVFSEAELLRYPLRQRERFVARHFLG